MRVIVTRRTSPTGFYGRNRHRERALHVNGRTANSRPGTAFPRAKSSVSRSLSTTLPMPLQGGGRGSDRIHEESIDVRAFYGRSGFPAAAVHAYSPTNVEMLTQREEERERERMREGERWKGWQRRRDSKVESERG